jgi:hypothetical protein
MPDDVTQVHELAGQSPSETLRAAAAVLRGLASHATPGPWRQGGIGEFGWTVLGPSGCIETEDSDQGRNDATWVGTMSPAVAKPLALILESYIPAAHRVEAQVSLYAVREAYDAALAFARTILEQP